MPPVVSRMLSKRSAIHRRVDLAQNAISRPRTRNLGRTGEAREVGREFHSQFPSFSALQWRKTQPFRDDAERHILSVCQKEQPRRWLKLAAGPRSRPRGELLAQREGQYLPCGTGVAHSGGCATLNLRCKLYNLD